MKTEIFIRDLIALNIFSSKEETRYYLNGVNFKRGDGKVILTATDGHRLGRIERIVGGNEETFIIPTSLIKKIKVDKKSPETAEIEISEKEDKKPRTITISYNGATYSEPEVDGTYPDADRVIPDMMDLSLEEAKRRSKLSTDEAIDEFKGQSFGFRIGLSPRYLGDFEKVAKTLGFDKQAIFLTMSDETSPVLVKIATVKEFLGVIMPMRA